MEKKLTYNDFFKDGLHAIKYSGMPINKAEAQLRKMMHGASQKEMESAYHQVFKTHK